MWLSTLLFFIFVLSLIQLSICKTFATCDLLTELEIQGFPQDQLKNWLCLIEAESSRRTNVIGGPDSDGSYDYGLFQINDRYWCSNTTIPGKGCNVRCKDLLTIDITKASVCAMKIYRQQGFDAWVGWVEQCKGKILQEFSC